LVCVLTDYGQWRPKHVAAVTTYCISMYIVCAQAGLRKEKWKTQI